MLDLDERAGLGRAPGRRREAGLVPGVVRGTDSGPGIGAPPGPLVAGRGVGVPAVSVAPEDAGSAFGSFIGAFFAMDMSSSSALTQELLGWTPTGPTLLEDLESGSYFRR